MQKEELQTQLTLNKRIRKRGRKRILQNSLYPQKEFLIQMVIPRTLSLKQYFRTKENIQFSLTTFNDNPLGDLGVNIFTIGYSIVKTELQKEQLEYSFQARDLALTEISSIFGMLDRLKLREASKNLQKYLDKYNQIEHIPKQTFEDLQKIQTFASQYPFECYTFRHQNGESTILNYTHNLKFLSLMGITHQMLEQYLSENHVLPCAIHVPDYLDTWQQVFGAVSNDEPIFDVELKNFNGQRIYTKINQIQMFVEENDELYGFLFWIYLIEPNENLAIENGRKEFEKLFPKPRRCTYKII